MNGREIHERRLARRVEDATGVVDVPLVPQPTVPPRPASYEEITTCKSSLDLAIAAAKAGFEPSWVFSKGPYIGAGGTVLERDVDALSLRLRREGVLWLAALWYRRAGKKWEFEAAWEFVTRGMLRLSSKQIRPFLKEHAQ